MGRASKSLGTLWMCCALVLLSACGGKTDVSSSPFTARQAAVVYNRDDLYQFFAVAFNAAPGVTYMGQLLDAANAGLSVKEIVNIFTTKSQFTDVYPTSMSDLEFAQKLVANVVGTSASPEAQQQAINDIIGALQAPGWTRGDVIFAIFTNLANKPDTDPLWAGTSAKMKKQVIFAQFYTETLHGDTTDVITLRNVIADVTESSNSTYPDIARSILISTNTTFGSYPNASLGNIGQKPVAVAGSKAVYAIGPYVMLDGSKSYDPQGKTLTYNWSVPAPPAGWSSAWGGFLDQTNRGTIAFYTYQQGGSYHGTFDAELTVSNGTEISDPITVPITVCCSANETVANATSFNAKLKTYTVAEAKALYQSYNPQGWVDDFRFAASYQFNFPQLDFLKGAAPGASITEWRNNARNNPYTLTNGGSEIANYSMVINNVIQVPTDLSKASYPADYQLSNAKDSEVIDPYCNNNPAVSTYRAADLGNFALPVIKESPLPSNALKLANIKDIWDVMTPSIGESCHKDVAVSWSVTFDKLKQLGVNAISITPWSFIFANDSGWVVPAAGTVPQISQMNDSDVQWIVTQAKSRGFKVYWVNQLQGVIKPDGSFLTVAATTASDVNNAVDAITNYLGERGAFLQSIGVDGVIAGSWYWVNFASYLDANAFSSANVKMIGALRQNFHGEVIYAPSGVSDVTNSLNSVVDKYIYNTYVGFDASTIGGYSVDAVKKQYLANINGFAAAAGAKPIIFDTSIQSRAGFFTVDSGYYDPFCTPSGSNPCIQTTLSGDYSMQAIFMEAVLESSVESGVGFGGIFMPYFVDPNLLPPHSFYNIDATVRGKPAEYLFYRWFNK